MPANSALSVQVFGYRDSRATQQAIRFFRERRVTVSFVDLAQRPLARGELLRFSQKFGSVGLMDDASKPYRDAGLAYLRLDEDQAFERLLANPRLIRLPLVRAASRIAIGSDEATWREWLRQSTDN